MLISGFGFVGGCFVPWFLFIVWNFVESEACVFPVFLAYSQKWYQGILTGVEG